MAKVGGLGSMGREKGCGAFGRVWGVLGGGLGGVEDGLGQVHGVFEGSMGSSRRVVGHLWGV